MFVFQSSNSNKWKDRESCGKLSSSRQSRSNRADSSPRNKAKLVGRGAVVSLLVAEGGSENINPCQENFMARRKMTGKAGRHQPLHTLLCHNNNQPQSGLRKYHLVCDDTSLSEDEGIGSAENLTSSRERWEYVVQWEKHMDLHESYVYVILR